MFKAQNVRLSPEGQTKATGMSPKRKPLPDKSMGLRLCAPGVLSRYIYIYIFFHICTKAQMLIKTIAMVNLDGHLSSTSGEVLPTLHPESVFNSFFNSAPGSTEAPPSLKCKNGNDGESPIPAQSNNRKSATKKPYRKNWNSTIYCSAPPSIPRGLQH